MGPIPCKAQTAGSAPRSAQTPIVLNPGETISAEIPAKGKRTFTIAACAGCFAEVLVEQMHESMPMAILSGPGIVDPIPRFCDAGIHSVVRIPFISPQSGNYELEIHLARPSSETVRITLAASRPATASDRDVVAAYDALARAEGSAPRVCCRIQLQRRFRPTIRRSNWRKKPATCVCGRRL